MISLHLFFSSSHTTSLHGLQYNSAFVDGSEFSFYWSGFLLWINTFFPHVLASLILPPNVLVANASVLGGCVAVYLHRRHLMIFGVFAPHWAFACCFAVITWVIKLLGLVFLTAENGKGLLAAQRGKQHLK